jgi:Trk K+ transport system NAD-binding subunit
MSRTIRRALLFLAPLPLLVLAIAGLYMLGMRSLEGQPRSFWDALEWAAETLTTTGYGADAHWSHPVMVVFVVATQFIGLFLFFLVFPIVVIPFLESRFEERLPRQAPRHLRNFVLVYRYGPTVFSLLQDLEGAQIPAVVLEEDEATARRLRQRGLNVVYTSLEEENPLGSAINDARALVANGADYDNAVIVLCARQNGFEGPIYALVDNPMHREPIVFAGATAAFSPKHALAAALAAQASDRISPRVAGIQQLGEHLEVVELRVGRDSPLANRTVGTVRLRERTGATVVGQWIGGRFEADVRPETLLRAGAILVVVGSGEAIERLGRLARPLPRGRRFVIAGCGEVGRRVRDMLNDVGEETVTIDQVASAGVDIVADALDPQALQRAGVAGARAVILALSSDSTNLFGASVVRDLAPDVPIIARVNQTEDVNRIRAAGADFALSISQVAGQLLGRRILGEEFVALEPRMRVAKASAAGLAGLDPITARVRERTGCWIVAVERGGQVHVEIGHGFELREGDVLYLVGPGEAVARYFELYPDARQLPAPV